MVILSIRTGEIVAYLRREGGLKLNAPGFTAPIFANVFKDE